MKCEMPDTNVLIVDKLNRYSLSLEVEEYSLDTNERVSYSSDISCSESFLRLSLAASA